MTENKLFLLRYLKSIIYNSVEELSKKINLEDISNQGCAPIK